MTKRVVRISRVKLIEFLGLKPIYNDNGLELHFRKAQEVPFSIIKNIEALKDLNLLSDMEVRREMLNTRTLQELKFNS